MLGQAISLIAELEHPRILRAFGALLRTMCAGEIRETLVMRGRHGSREEYYRSIEARTTSLFAAGAEMAAILAGAPEAQIAALRRFGCELGIAYQIVDDVLDVIGDEAQLGKPAGSDLRQGLITLPILRYLEQTAGDSPVRAALAGECSEECLRAAMEVVRSSGAIEGALDEARAHARRGQEALAMLPAGLPRRMLCDLAEYVVERRN